MNFIRRLFHRHHVWLIMGLRVIPNKGIIVPVRSERNIRFTYTIKWDYKECRRCGKIDRDK